MKNISAEKWARAMEIPELGHGGAKVAEDLVELARSLSPGATIVEIAPWLGSATAFLALGSPARTTIHSFDLWKIDEHWQFKASRYHGLKFEIGRDIMPDWHKNVEAVIGNRDVRLDPHRGDVRSAVWDPEQPIDLFVDDISNTAEVIDSTMGTFGPAIRKGAHLLMMDYQFPQAQAQRDWFAVHEENYQFVRFVGDKAALLRKL